MDAEVADYLCEQHQVFLLTHRADGWPTGYPMVGNYRDGGVEFNTYRASAKVTRVLREARAAGLVVPRDDSPDRRCLWFAGPAAIREDVRGLGAEPGAAPPRGSLPTVADDVVANVARKLAEGKRCILRVEVAETRWIEPLPQAR